MLSIRMDSFTRSCMQLCEQILRPEVCAHEEYNGLNKKVVITLPHFYQLPYHKIMV